MKRITEEPSRGGSQFKRPGVSSRPESYTQMRLGRGEDGGASLNSLTTNDALTYLKNVKEMFQDQRDKYEQFLDVMKDFKAQRTDTAGVIERVKQLFKGHDNLIIGFNTFLPKGFEITLEDTKKTEKAVEFQEAIGFVNKIKKRFLHDDTVYKSFLDILNMYRKEQKGITEVYQEVSALLDDHRDLLEEFMNFLPPPSAQNMYKGNPIQRNDDQDAAVAKLEHVPVQREHRRDKIVSSHPDRLYYPDIDDDVSMVRKYTDQKNPAENDIRERRTRNNDFIESDHDIQTHTKAQRVQNKRNPARQVEGFGSTHGMGSDDDKASKKSIYNHEFSFCQKVKERLSDPDDYQSFLKYLNIYSSDIVTREELQRLVAKLLREYPDLMDGFDEFLEHCENIDVFIASLMNDESLGIDQDMPRSLNKDKEKMQEMPVARVKDRHRDEYLAKSIQELDLSNCKRCTPSYRHLPDDYPIPMASQRSNLGAQVLNDYWVSMTSGSEDYSFKHMRRNQYEEALFRCEDDRFELDVLIEATKSTIARIEELLHKIVDKLMVVDGPVRIEDHFTTIHLRCIERLYGDHCLDAMDFLRKRFLQALPVIAIRLKQRQEDWSKTRSGFNNVWAEVYAKNHYNSLDHRSFYFKQQDLKNLHSKSLLSEIQEMKEARQKEVGSQMDTITGGKVPAAPNMEFEYPDMDLHADVHRLLQFSCEEVCSTKEQSGKVMQFWSSFVEPILGVASQQHGVGTEGVLIYKKQDVQDSISDAVRNNGGNSLECGASCMEGPEKGETPVLELISSDFLCAGGNNNCSNTLESRKEQNALMVSCKASEKFNGQGFPNDKTTNSDVPHSIGEDSRMDIEVISALSGPKRERNEEEVLQKPISDATPSEGANSTIFGRLRNDSSTVGDTAKNTGHHSISVEPFKTEKEEGELSPTADSDNELDNWSKPNDDNERSQYHEDDRGTCSAEAVGENDACAFGGDKGNAFLDGKASGSESGDDECSRQEHDQEQVELNVCNSIVKDKSESARIVESKSVKSVGVISSMSERFLDTAKPLSKHFVSSSSGPGRKRSRIFYGNDDFYILFRLHQILYDRLLFAKKNSTVPDVTKLRSGPDCYSRFMDALYNLLDGTIDDEEYEDECRALLGNHSYTLFTLDKLIYRLVKQLQTIATDEMDIKLVQIFEYEASRKDENYTHSVYHENARVLQQDEELFRFKFSSCPSSLSILLMDGGEKPEAVAVALEPKFAGYLYNDFLSAYLGRREPLGVVLQRNKWKLYAGLDEITALDVVMEDVKIANRLECKIDCNSSKVSYVLGTEDVLFRRRRKRRDVSAVRFVNQCRAKQFHRILLARHAPKVLLPRPSISAISQIATASDLIKPRNGKSELSSENMILGESERPHDMCSQTSKETTGKLP